MRFEIEAQVREQAGKGVARQLRRNGKIPAVLYGQGRSLFLVMDPAVVRKILMSQAGSTGLISVRLSRGNKQEERVALLQDYQVDPITGALLHVDLFEVSMDKSIRVKVPVSIVGGVSVGVKEGGALHQPMRELHVECLPAAIPDHIEVDASSLQIGQGIHVRELPETPGVKVLDDADLMVVNVSARISEAKLEALLTSGAAEAAPAEPVVAEKGPEKGTEKGAEKAKAEEPAADSKASEGKK